MTLFSLRSALLIVIVLGVAVAAGVLTYFATPKRNLPAAVLAGGAAAGGALVVFNPLLAP